MEKVLLERINKLELALKNSEDVLEEVKETIDNWFASDTDKGEVYTDVVNQLEEIKNLKK